VLVARAAERFGVDAAGLVVSDGVVAIAADPARAVSYAELIADGFAAGLDWNGQYGNGLNVTGAGASKAPADYRVVGTSVARKDIPGKMLATTEFCHHVTLPGMLHGRCLRPPVANAVPVAVDATSIAAIAGARVVREGDFLAVVADDEWAAIRAARELAVVWSETAPPFPAMDALYDHIREAPVAADNSVANFGPRRAYDPAIALAAIAAAPTQVAAEYELPFQSHARMAPSVGVADVGDDGAVIFSDTQKPHNTRDGIARLLNLDPASVRVIWKPGPGSYGRSDADEAAFEAAVLSRATGRPVRVQWMRHEGHGWDPKAPAAVIGMQAGLAANGDIAGWYMRAKGFSGWDVLYNASEPRDTLVGQLLGHARGDAHNFGVPGESYGFPNTVRFWETIAPLLARASPLRTAHMRAPQEPQLHFAQECFIDEVAAAAGVDPIALRLKYLTDAREIAVLEAVARLSNWQSLPLPTAPRRLSGGVLRGRGVAINSGFGGFVATVCEVEVEPATGRVWPRRVFVAHDCGLIINPQGLRTTIEGNIVQGISRTLYEEVQFDQRNVLSVDWTSYPILEIGDAPEAIEIELINRPDRPPGGAGEPAHVTVPAALGNALFDATGVRVRRLPLSPERVRASLA
jgi:xanthine dehydrogenase molybdopterin-binding subunit B